MPENTDKAVAPVVDNVLEVDDLCVSFFTEEGEVKAVNGVSFEVGRGRCMAIVGESGSGKSVTAYSIMRLIQSPGKIVGGKIRVFPHGQPVIDVAQLRDKDPLLYHVRGGLVSMIFQEPMTALSPVHTVGNQICEAILLHREVTPAEAKNQAVQMLTRVGIPNPEARMRQYPYEFSGGMRQRVVIAMALVCKPVLLIADEPTTALDVTIQAQILTLIRELQQELGTSVLFITHDIGVVAQIADDVAVMYRGRIVERGTVRQVIKKPLHPYTKGLLGAIPGLAAPGTRLPTIESVLAGRDISRPMPLLTAPDGRLVALSDTEIQEQFTPAIP
ncbi:MAG: ABC transporter ATP-binding protein [Verrucomicrobia bacterium]|nr:ABC transporter ATP-binding protein [Verrucomicrobiota bacterium]